MMIPSKTSRILFESILLIFIVKINQDYTHDDPSLPVFYEKTHPPFILNTPVQRSHGLGAGMSTFHWDHLWCV